MPVGFAGTALRTGNLSWGILRMKIESDLRVGFPEQLCGQGTEGKPGITGILLCCVVWREQASSLQEELGVVRRRLGELEQLYAQQKSSTADASAQGEELTRRLAGLERELRDTHQDKVGLILVPFLFFSRP